MSTGTRTVLSIICSSLRKWLIGSSIIRCPTHLGNRRAAPGLLAAFVLAGALLARPPLALAEPRPTARTHLAQRAGVTITDLMADDEAVSAHLDEVAATRDNLAPTTLRLGWYRIINVQGDTTLEGAFKTLVEDGDLPGVTLVILDEADSGLLGQLYARLRRRKFRATTGPDEGIDVSASPYGTRCIYVPVQEVDAIGQASWRGVLLHERRHLVQLANNPNLAADFVNEDGGRSLYAGFCEACADDGLYTTPLYEARARMAALRQAIGAEGEPLIRRACQGHVEAYEQLVAQYNQQADDPSAFARLFWPRY